MRSALAGQERGFGFNLRAMAYFEAGAGAGVAAVAGAALFTAAFLFFFTCFFATGAGAVALSVLVAGAVCAAKPTVANARESASAAEVMVFMVVCPVLFL